MPFPKGFLWGGAVAAHQLEGGWKDGGNPKDEWYFWRNAHSNIWYSSEIVGTIIVA